MRSMKPVWALILVANAAMAVANFVVGDPLGYAIGTLNVLGAGLMCVLLAEPD